jgi:sugar lactone lactonase YvrE
MSDVAQLLLDAGATLGEGPVWDDQRQELVWVDIRRALIHRYSPEHGPAKPVAAPDLVGAVALRENGGWALCLPDGVWVVDEPDGEPRHAILIEADDPRTRANDAKAGPDGRLWFGTMGREAEPGAGALYRVAPKGDVERVVGDVSISNGLAWAPDQRTMYYIDTATQRVDAFDYEADSGRISRRRELVRLADEDGSPDGMTIDAQGYLWVAAWGGGAVRRYSPAGTLDRVVDVAASQVSACAFGGPDLRDLFVTTARDGLSDEQLEREPSAGGLFVYRSDVPGVPADRFAG